jgi:hypothetical protein
MIEYKQSQSKSNQESIVDALEELDKPVSSKEIKRYLELKALEKAKSEAYLKYNNAEITENEIPKYISKNSKAVDLRTVQRWLTRLVKQEFVDRKNNKYSLSVTGKREIQFRQFAQGYGGIALKYIMDCHFPTINTLEKNIEKMVQVFGTYVVYCLIEAVRLITANKNDDGKHWHSDYFGAPSNFKEGKFRERRLIDSWIKDIFDPWQMLNLFLTTVSNTLDPDKARANNIKDEKAILKDYSKQYPEGSLFPSSGVFTSSFVDPIKKKEKENNNNDNNDNGFPSTTLELFFKRILDASTVPPGFGSWYEPKRSLEIFKANKELYHLSKLTTAAPENKLLYELDSKKIGELKKALSKHYPWYYKFLQKTDEIYYSKQNKLK